jgi:zinc transport system permease protein
VIEALQFTFMRNALMAGLLVSVAFGIIGTLVVINRIVFVSGGVAHAAYGGIGLGYFMRLNPVFGAMLFSLFAALGMGWVQRRTRERADTIIGVMWAVGMATGIILLDLTPGYRADLMSYLFGSILAVPTRDLLIMVILDGVILITVAVFYKELLAISFDETFATVQNVPVDAIYMVLMALIAFTVVMMMRVVGLIMVIALLTVPAAISGQFFKDMKKMMVGATLLGIVFTTTGLMLSYTWNLTSGATIILVSAVAYALALAIKALRSRRQRSYAGSSDIIEPLHIAEAQKKREVLGE